MDTSVDFFKRLVSCSYTCYARSADNPNTYFPWDNVHFKTKEKCDSHMKAQIEGNPGWADRLVVVKVEHQIVS
jgi:hypothetical protein